MENHFSTLMHTLLFADIAPADLQKLLKCLCAHQKTYEKNSFIFSVGDATTEIGVVLSGSIQVTRENFWGDRFILSRFFPGELFGESFSCAGYSKMPVNVVAAEKAQILLMNYQKVFYTCSSSCAFHAQLIQNMVKILASKNLTLTQKIIHVTQRTTREKLLSYLSFQSLKAGNSSFTIPFNRQELADYLAVDRSAMSKELCKMRDEGFLSFDRSHFHLMRIQ